MHTAKDLLSIFGNVGSVIAAVIAICGLVMARAGKKRGRDNP